MKIKQKKGISLIVLVITIVVMIILATVVILSLDSSNIIERANEAKEATNESNLKEAANVALAEYKLEVSLGNIDGNAISAKDYVKDKLEEQGMDTSLLIMTEDGKIKIKGKNSLAWEVKVGDKVAYEYAANNNVKAVRDNAVYSSADGGNMEITEWRVLAIKNGKVLLVGILPSTLNGVTSASVQLWGTGAEGVEEINRICSELYSSDFGTVRNAKEEDILGNLNSSINILQPCWLGNAYTETYQDDGSGNAWIVEAYGLKYLNNGNVLTSTYTYKDNEGRMGTDNTYNNYICPVVELNGNVTTNGKNADGAWILK